MSVTLRHWLKFNVIGIAGVFVQLAALAVLVTGLGMNYLFATVLAVEAAVIHNFVWHERWTWADTAKHGRPAFRLIKFNLANGLVSLAGNLLLMRFLTGTLGIHYVAANLLAIGTCSLVNFLLCDRLVFGRERKQLGRIFDRDISSDPRKDKVSASEYLSS